MVTLVKQKAHPIHSSRVKLSMLKSGRVLACYKCSKLCFRKSHVLLYCPWCKDPIGTGWVDQPDGRNSDGGTSNSEEWETAQPRAQQALPPHVRSRLCHCPPRVRSRLCHWQMQQTWFGTRSNLMGHSSMSACHLL